MISIKRPSVILLHIAAWLIFLSLPFTFILSQSGGSSEKLHFLANPLNWLYFLLFIVIFYLHTYVLFPIFFLGKKKMVYFISIIILAALIFFLKPFDSMVRGKENIRQMGPMPAMHNNMPPPPQAEDMPAPPGPAMSGRTGPAVDIISIALFILVISLSIALVISKRWRIAVEQAARAEADKANAELSFLKAQINPHFLFNTLNNIYSLALMQDEHTADSIMMLSNIMRYVTDDVTAQMVPLQMEADCINDYIALQKLRLSDATEVRVKMEGDFSNKEIAPLILMTFVENIFKYGTSNKEQTVVTISLRSDMNGIYFTAQNKLFPLKKVTERTGIGIANTSKRLEQLYAGRYDLNINTDNEVFTVTLSLLT